MSDFSNLSPGSGCDPSAGPHSHTRKPKIVFVGSLTTSLTNFRYDILKELSQRADVIACGPERHPKTEATLADLGIEFRQFPLSRAGLNPFQDLSSLRALIRICRDERPDMVVSYTMKPMIFSGLAARLTGVPQNYAMCTGLGYVFSEDDQSFFRNLLRKLSVALYRISLKDVDEVFVYNSVDAAEFRSRRLIAADVPMLQIPGSGVNLEHYQHSEPPSGPPVFLMVARLLRYKGVFEYVEAARMLRQKYPDARCQLLGPLDDNPNSVSAEQLSQWQKDGDIEYLGETDDVRPYLRDCSVFVLPTAYREGIPRSILEAMSTGRAVITTDAPGCEDAVSDGQTGFIVPMRDSQKLADAMQRFVEDQGLIATMGREARHRAENEFDVARVNTILLQKMGLMSEHESLPPSGLSIQMAANEA